MRNLFHILKKKNLIRYVDDSIKKELSISFNKKLAKTIYKSRKEFGEGHPLYTSEFGHWDVVLGIFDVTGKGDKYYITFSEGPSFDVSYCFNKVGTVERALKNKVTYIPCDDEIFALSLILPGNGNIYSYGHNNTMHNIKRKYVLTNGKIHEISQPFYYIGKKTVSLKDQAVYSDENLNKVAFRITKGYRITVVGIKSIKYRNSRKDLYLVSSEFGLIGWVMSDNSQTETQFQGFYFYGD